MLDKIGVQVEKLEMMKIYKRADVNGDGTVSFREFMAAFANDSNNRYYTLVLFKKAHRLLAYS